MAIWANNFGILDEGSDGNRGGADEWQSSLTGLAGGL